MIRKHLSLLKEHPQGLWWLMFAEFWDRFSFYGIQAMLVLFLTQRLVMDDSVAYAIYGGFTALTFVGTILGGIAADRFLGFNKALIIGAILMIAGNVLLLTLSVHTLYLGLALVIVGIALFKPNNASLIGALYHDHDARRDSGFSLFYMSMNAGGILGPLCYGFLSLHLGWSSGFAMSAIGMTVALLCLLLKQKQLKEHQSNRRVNLHKRTWFGLQLEIYLLVVLGLMIALFVALLQHSNMFAHVIDVVGAVTLLGLAWVALRSNATDRKHIIGLVILSVLAITFFACSLQTATTLTLFIERQINKHILGFNIPTMAFLSLEPLFIILMAPFIAKLWDYLKQTRWEPSPPMKMSLGIFSAALSFLCFALAATCHSLGGCRAVLWVIIGNIPLGLGELLIFPVALSSIASYAPLRLRGTMMGVFFLSLAFGGFFAGLMANFISTSHQVVTSMGHEIDYTHAFLQIATVTAMIGAIVCVLSFWLKQFLTD